MTFVSDVYCNKANNERLRIESLLPNLDKLDLLNGICSGLHENIEPSFGMLEILGKFPLVSCVVKYRANAQSKNQTFSVPTFSVQKFPSVDLDSYL